MAKAKVIHTHVFTSGIDTTTAPEYKPNNVCEYILNCNSLSSSSGNVGIITNIKGNTLIPTTLPEGENIRIGWVPDEESNNFYTFLWNSEGYHTIYRFNTLEGRETVILQNLTDTNNIDILKFDREYLILHADVVRNNLIYWVDGLNNARKFNIDKALDKSSEGYGITILEDYINAYKRTSAFAPTAVYFSDTTKQFNRLYGKLYKFIVRFIYDDGEKSNWSEYSNTPLPLAEPITGISAIPSNNNGITITYETGSNIVTHVEIAMQSTDASTTEDGTLNFVLIASLNKSILGIPSNSTATYSFYNDGNYSVTDPEKVIRPYSFIPKKPRCQNIVKNALIYWNGYEGFDNVELNTEIEVAYEDLFIADGTENEFNEPEFIRTAHSVAYVRGSNGNRETYETLAIGSDVKKGNIFQLQFVTNGVVYGSWTYTATAFDTATTVANYFRTKIIAWPPTKDGTVSAISVDGSGTASWSYTIRQSSYTDGFPSVTPVQFNSLKDTGESVNNIKLGSSIKFGLTYEDEDGRKSLVYTLDGLIVNISPINEFDAFKKPIITLQIKHRPPIWAKYYQVVRSPDLIYKDYIQLLIQQAIDFEGTDDTDYLDLVVGSLPTYQKLHPNTVLQYSFKTGDRIRLRSWFDIDTSVETFYDFFETEILSYSPTITTVKDETLTTTTGSDVVTISGVTSADNIGRVILVDGAERTIIAAPSGTTYQVSSAMPDNESYLTYSLIDRRSTVRIRKPSTDIIPEFKDYSIVELYTPSTANASADVKTFNEFGMKFPILNWGTNSRSHAGVSQNQDGTSSSTLISTPAIIEIDNGTAYVRNRELPVTNNVPGAQVVIAAIEDSGYSDFYNSMFNNNGRLTVEDTGDGEVHFGSRARYSNNYIEDTRINGLNDFDNLDREDYNDAYGDVVRTFFSENRVYVFKKLKDAWVPVRQNILSQANGVPVVGLSSKLLNDMQYFQYDGGIGENPESLAYNASWIYHVMPNAGVIVRLGGNGVIPISELYQLDNAVKEYLRDAKTYGARIYGGFDRFNGLYVMAIADYRKYIFSGGFTEAQWQLFDDEIVATSYEIVTPPEFGDIAFTSATQWTYTPDADYEGLDSFTYRALINGVWSDPEEVVFNVTATGLSSTAWRGKSSTIFCVTDDGLQTGFKGWVTLEEYILGLGTLTGSEKPNATTDADYIAPVFDPTTCVPEPEQFTFTDSTNQNLLALAESNSITVDLRGIPTAVAISITGGEYEKNNSDVWTSAPGTVVDGDTVIVRNRTANIYSTAVNTVLTISGISDIFTSTTKVDPTPVAVSTPTPSACSVFLNDDDTKIYTYEVATTTNTFRIDLGNSASPDIAHTATKLFYGVFVQERTGFDIYDITFSPFTMVFNHRVLLPSSTYLGPAFTAKDNTNIIMVTTLDEGASSVVQNVDISGSGEAVVTTLFSLQTGRFVLGDVLYNSITDTYIISNGSGVNNFITEYSSDGTVLTDIAHAISFIYGLFEDSGNLYGVSSAKVVYHIEVTGLTMINTISGITGTQLYGASQTPSCITFNF